LLNIKEGDEVIIPSFTFVSTANAFVLRGARIVFVDSSPKSPNIDVAEIEALITPRTKAIVVVHYAGVACEMDTIMSLALKYGLFVVEDAAKSIASFYKGRPLGSIGHLATFSFHETKNIQCGEGGCLIINDERLFERAEIIREKGTNRTAFFRGEVDKYCWIDIGSSFLPSDISAAFLFAQLESIDFIQKRRLEIWDQYFFGLKRLSDLGKIAIPSVTTGATNNAHMFYVLCKNYSERKALAHFLLRKGVMAISHYEPLHNSPFYKDKHDGRVLSNCVKYSETVLRLPLFVELTDNEVNYVISNIHSFFKEPYEKEKMTSGIVKVRRGS
jgi:dTDP-4-amino-4,6-dideoxygalactose transaminase